MFFKDKDFKCIFDLYKIDRKNWMIFGENNLKNVMLFIIIIVFVVYEFGICSFVDWRYIYCVLEIDNNYWWYNKFYNGLKLLRKFVNRLFIRFVLILMFLL